MQATRSFHGDLVVLPELCMCGYLFQDRDSLWAIAEEVPVGPSTQAMTKLSEECDCVIVFGLAEKEGDFVYNTAVVVGGGKYLGKYRKVHLSDLEKKLFERGKSNAVVDTGKYKIGVQICFDLWFPEISREQIKQGAQILCALANFGGETTGKIAQIRAIENLTPLVLCNRVGIERLSEIDAYFLGKSQILNKNGECVGLSEKDSEVAEVREIEVGTNHTNIICRDFDAEINIHPLYAADANMRVPQVQLTPIFLSKRIAAQKNTNGQRISKD